MSQLFVNQSSGTGGPVNTINSQPPVAGNFNLTSTGGTVAITSAPGAINFEVSNVYGPYRRITFADSPYSALVTDYFISVDTSGGAISIILPTAPTTNQTFLIKDRTGNANTNNITVTSVGNTMDTTASYIIEGNYESSSFLFNTANYETF